MDLGTYVGVGILGNGIEGIATHRTWYLAMYSRVCGYWYPEPGGTALVPVVWKICEWYL